MLLIPLQIHQYALVIISLLIISACEFDQDSQFFPETTQAVFLTTNATEDRHLLLIEESAVDSIWEVQLGITSGAVSDISAINQELWVGSAEDRIIGLIDVNNRTLTNIQETGTFQPHFIGVGKDRVVAADTVADQLGFWDKEDFNVVITDLGSKPGVIAYRSGKFYIAIDRKIIVIWDERAIAERNRITTSTPIIDILIDNSVSTIAIQKDSVGLFETVVNFNTDHASRLDVPISHQKIRYTPFLRQSLGKELTENVLLTDSILSIRTLLSISGSITDFEVDFTESQLWILRENSLNLYRIREENEEIITSFSGSLVKSFFNQEIEGD